MEIKNLQRHIRTLVMLEETESPVLSCYLDLEKGEAGYRETLDERWRLLRQSLTGKAVRDLEDVFARIDAFLKKELLPRAKGVAIFGRGGAQPFFLPLQFQVPLPNWIVADSTPNIYHLVELKDTYHRYVVVVATDEKACILEVNLGSVTEQIWKERPELRKRVGREWTKEHYQNHRRERTDQFFKEMIKILDQMMLASGYTHLILAGNPRITSRIRNALPKHLVTKLIGPLFNSGNEKLSDIVASTLSSFIKQEEKESQAMVDRLQQRINTHGLAVAGTEASLNALMWGQADMLLLAMGYDPDPGWLCLTCGIINVSCEQPDVCPKCENKGMREISIKEEMVRMAERTGCQVEVAGDSDILMRFGGVGCLLRYPKPERNSKHRIDQ